MNGCEINDYDAILDRHRALLAREACHFAYFQLLVIGSKDSPSIVHTPFTLLPSQFPRAQFDQAWDASSAFGLLVHRISRDLSWLEEAHKRVIVTDSFTANLLKILKRVHENGISNDSDGASMRKQKVSFGIHRSDYMLHRSPESGEDRIYQVEINTISSSFGMFGSRVAKLHRHSIEWAKEQLDPALLDGREDASKVPDNISEKIIVDSFVFCHRLFLSQEHGCGEANPVVLMIVQQTERNFGDQRLLEFHLAERNIRLIRRTLLEIYNHSTLDDHSNLVVSLENGSKVVASIVYFRAGYTPVDYPTESEWVARERIESSSAIKCPTIAYHISGTKKVQQLLSMPGVVERFLPDRPDFVTKIRNVFTGLYDIKRGDEIFQKAIERPDLFVMKPQREGGGNLVFGEHIPRSLQTFSEQQLEAYILMDRIHTPSYSSIVVHQESLNPAKIIAELGIFTVFVGSEDEEEIYNKPSGYLLRSKPESEADGGVVAGIACLDSVYLT